jgi:hypothetical protein
MDGYEIVRDFQTKAAYDSLYTWTFLAVRQAAGQKQRKTAA